MLMTSTVIESRKTQMFGSSRRKPGGNLGGNLVTDGKPSDGRGVYLFCKSDRENYVNFPSVTRFPRMAIG
jgi:hypothetical protein